MAETNSGKAELFRLYTAEYMEKIFYFCLKKTGGPQEAEELSSDIAISILAALDRGTRPEHFSGWVWQIARNRYSAWADRKHRRMSLLGGTMEQLDLPDPASDTEEEYLRSEQAALLRRELAFICADYRKILAAYYLEGQQVKEIASRLSLPSGTVMTRLHRARKLLKEGMEMAKEFGRRSYQPEEFGFSSSGHQPSGLPFRAVQRKIPVNILLHAANNPCTLEELALELGIAMAYMEEEVDLLCKSELLKKLENGKYVTGFFIEPKECQNEIAALKCAIADAYARDFWNRGGAVLKLARECGADTRAYCENDAHLFFALYLEQRLIQENLPEGVYTKFKRADGGNWGFMGHEHGARYPIVPIPMSNNCSNWRGLRWEGYQSCAQEGNPLTDSRHAEDVPDGYLHGMLRAVAEGQPVQPREDGCDDLSVLLSRRFVLRREDGSFAVNAILFPGGSGEQLSRKLSSMPEYAALSEVVRSHIAQVRKIVASYSNPWLEKDVDYYTAMSVLLRGVLVRKWLDMQLYRGDCLQFCAFYF